MNERAAPPPPPASRQPITQPAPIVAGRDREFLPAAIEILETPAPPLPVVTMLTICAFFAAALAWSFYGQLDVHAVAPGKIDTAGRAKVIQPLDPGKVAAVHVENGQRVRAGDLLLEFDPAEPAAEENAQRDALHANLAEIARRRFAIATARAVLDGPAKSGEPSAREAIVTELAQAAADPAQRIVWAVELPEAFRLREAAVLTHDVNQLIGALQSLDRQMAQKEATRQRLGMSIAYQDNLIETLTKLLSVRQQSFDLKVGTKVNLYGAMGELAKSQSSRASDEGELIETEAALKELASEKIKTLSQFVADNGNKQAGAERKADEAKQAVVKAAARLARTRLYSPIDGVGVLDGKVMHVASEAVEEQEAKRGLANAPATANANTAVAPPAGQAGQPQSFVFPVTVALEEQAMNINGATIPLTSGMTVTVEIKTDSRRVIDYLLSPLAKITSEALKER